MDVYERLTELMRESGKYHNPPGIMIGIMGTKGKIKLDSLVLDTDDYLMNCNLRIEGEKMFYHKEKTSTSTYMTDSAHNATLSEYKNNILSEGDTVLMMKMPGIKEGEEKEKYILIAKVVSPA